MGALFENLRIDPARSQQNIIDVSDLPAGKIFASELAGFGDNCTIIGLKHNHTFVFDNDASDGLDSNYHNISFQTKSGQDVSGTIVIDEHAFVDVLSITGNKMSLKVDGSLNDLDAQGTHVFAFAVGAQGRIHGMHAGEATIQSGVVAGTIEGAHFNDATLNNITFKEGAFLHNVDFTGASVSGVTFEPGVNLEDIYVNRPREGRSYFASLSMMQAQGLHVTGAGSIQLSAQAVEIVSRASPVTMRDVAETLDTHTLNALRGLGSHVRSGANGVIEEGDTQTAILDAEALKALKAAKEATHTL
jgi:hypothetical protein